MKESFSKKDLLGIVVSIVMLVFVFRTIHLDLFWQNYHQMNGWALILCMIIHCIQTFILGKRWTALFRQDSAGLPVSGVPSYWLGNFYNAVLPGRLGDVVRVFHYSAKSSIHYKKVFAALIIERFLDLQVVAFFGVVYLFLFPIHIALINWMILGLTGIILGIDVFLLISAYNRRILKIAMRFLPGLKLRSWIYGLIILVLGKMEWLFRTRKILLFLFISLALYLVGILCFYLDLRASRLENIFADFSICISFPIFFLILHLIPSAPSSAGVLHFGIFKALVIIAKSKGIIITAALENQILFSAAVFHFSLFFPETAVGLYYMLRERTILFDLRKSGLLKKS